MRLMFIANDFPSPYEPTKGTFNYHLAKALARDHEVQVISPISWVDELRARRHLPRLLGRQRSLNLDGVAVHHPRYYYPPKVLRNHYGFFYWRSLRPTVQRLIAGRPPEAVIGYWAHPDGAAAVRVAREVGVPSGVIVGGSDVLLLARDQGRRRRIREVLRAADSVVTVSAHLREAIIGLGIAGEKVHLWQRGIDAALFSPGERAESRSRLGLRDEGRILVAVGRLVPVKGLDVLIQACALLRDRGVEFHLHLVGEGPLRPSLEADVVARGLSAVVSFVGPRGHEQLADWYRAADLTVLSSRSEGLPNVLRESLACGTPFVASRVGGVAEIAAEGGGRLVAPGDPGALAEGIAASLAESGQGRRPRPRMIGWAESAESLLGFLRPNLPIADVLMSPAECSAFALAGPVASSLAGAGASDGRC